MEYIVCKPVNLFGARQRIGTAIPGDRILESSARRLLRMGYIVKRLAVEPAEEAGMPPAKSKPRRKSDVNGENIHLSSGKDNGKQPG